MQNLDSLQFLLELFNEFNVLAAFNSIARWIVYVF